jgi:hypothetical protein
VSYRVTITRKAERPVQAPFATAAEAIAAALPLGREHIDRSGRNDARCSVAVTNPQGLVLREWVIHVGRRNQVSTRRVA